ncbi:MAG TPA: NAD-dependent epimerase/dehydratase family protein [Candidatus Omnitrophota bacterium]|nr:NAD-dependent epimerase/dehydratase family protein [Candidatus Omnitrophota bacterium]
MQEKILVTGGSGLLGHAVRKIVPGATFLTSQNGDLRDAKQTDRIFGDKKPDRVLHLAAKVGGVKINAERNADFFADNIQINTNVLASAQKHKVKGLVSLLSSCAFPFYSGRPTRETDLHSGLPFPGNLGYGCAKRMLDIQTRLLWEQHGCRFTTVTPVTMYGPHDHWDLENSHVLSALIHKCFHAKQSGKTLVVWGSGEAVRQFVFSGDVARLILKTGQSIESPDTVILAPDSGIKIRDLAGIIAGAMKFKGKIRFDKSKPEGQRVRVLKSNLFPKRFPGFKFTKLEKGLEETVEWFLENHNSFCGTGL